MTSKPIGNVFRPMKGVIDLRTFDAGFIKSFFPVKELESKFAPDHWFKYAETQGDLALRSSIAGQIGLSAAHVLITDGASQALLLAILTVLGRGDTLFLPHPVFPAYTRMAAMRECFVEYYACDKSGDDLREKLIAYPEGRRAGVIINSPHNPTGLVLSTAVLADLVALAARKGIQTILDDTYHWLTGDIDQFTQLPRVAVDSRLAESTFAIASLGKFLCLPGLRLGFIATANAHLLDQMTEAKRHLSYASCHASEQLVLSILTSDAWRQGRADLAAKLQSRRRTFELLTAPHGVDVRSPALGFYAYAAEVNALSDRGIVGITGKVFDTVESEARYCLAASDEDWRKLADAL